MTCAVRVGLLIERTLLKFLRADKIGVRDTEREVRTIGIRSVSGLSSLSLVGTFVLMWTNLNGKWYSSRQSNKNTDDE